MPNLLVTGGAGFIGSNFVRYWRHAYPDDTIVLLDALTYAGHMSSIADIKNIHFIHGDIRNGALVEETLLNYKIDTLVHFAAESHVDRSINDPDIFLHTNITGTYELLKAAKKIWIDKSTVANHRFHHVSTDEVYGSLDLDSPASTEESNCSPNSPYAASKASSDHLVRAYHQTYGLQTTISRCSNNFGPYQFPEKLIPLFLLNALHGRPLPIYGDGQQIRDWVYVEDHCKAIDLILKKGCVGHCYNIGSGMQLSNNEVINLLCAAVDKSFAENRDLAQAYPNSPAAKGDPVSCLRRHVTDRLGHDRRYAVDIKKIQSELHFEPTCDFGLYFSKTLIWYIDHKDWWRNLYT